MSAPETTIRAAFTAKLKTLPSLPAVAWENMSFTPPAGAPYLQPALLPGEPFQAEQGESGRNRHPGIYQVSVYYPAGTGTAGVNALRDSIVNLFKRGTILTRDGLTITVTKAFPSPMIPEGADWVRIPVTIRYRCDAAP